MATGYENLISGSSGTSTAGATTTTNPGSVLDKDSFMKLLLVELEHQDPTDPMDSDKILTQTSQLATLESASNTNKALEELATQLSASRDLRQYRLLEKWQV